jgi:hypothetical protein
MAIQTQGGEPPNVRRVVAGMRAGLRACYQHGLASDPQLQGKVRLTIRVDSTGAVTNATVTADNPELERHAAAACIRTRAHAARFEAPGKASIVTVDVALSIQKAG